MTFIGNAIQVLTRRAGVCILVLLWTTCSTLVASQDQEPTLGIDLGTTNTVASIQRTPLDGSDPGGRYISQQSVSVYPLHSATLSLIN